MRAQQLAWTHQRVCMAGPGTMPDPTTPPTTPWDRLDTFDFNVDNDVDLAGLLEVFPQ